MLKIEIQAQVLALFYGQKRSVRSIASELGLNRKTVAKIVARRAVHMDRQNYQPKKSILDPFKDTIDSLLKKNPTLASNSILNIIRDEGFMGGQTTLRRYVGFKKQTPPAPKREAFLSLNFQPGECAQVDWGEFGTPFNDSIKIHAFVMVLAHSRLMYVEFTRSEKFEDFIRSHENAFKYFGNLVPKECWYDNLATAVTERMGSIVRFNSRFLAYMGHHGIRPHACNPARGNEKGRVEDGVKFIRSNFWDGRTFLNFTDLNQKAALWLSQFANKREHRATHKIPRLVFDHEEKNLMLPMNPNRFETNEVFSRVVPPNFFITYESNKYSVPWTLVGLTITLRISQFEIKIFYHDKFITQHLRSYKKNQIFENLEHKQSLLDLKPGLQNRELAQIQAIKKLGPALTDYVDYLKSSNRSLKNEIPKLLALATIYGGQTLNLAAAELLTAGSIGIDNLELILKNNHSKGSALNPAPISFQNNKLNRFIEAPDLRKYDALLFNSNNQTSPQLNNQNDPNKED